MASLFPDQLLAFSLLGLSVVALWFRPWCWAVVFCAFVAVSLWLDLLTPVALVPIVTLSALYFAYAHCVSWNWVRISLFILLSLLSVALGMHAFPGFSYWELSDSVRLSDTSASYAMRYYLDKPLIGVMVLGLAYSGLSRTWSDWREMIRRLWWPLLATLAIVYPTSIFLGYTQWDPKYSSVFWPWAVKNLLFVCVAEEAFFRGFLQKQLAELIPHRQAKLIALIVAAALFGIAHIAGGLNYVLLATVAGLGYGYVYLISERVEASILTHFLLNTGHFLFLTYPYSVVQ